MQNLPCKGGEDYSSKKSRAGALDLQHRYKGRILWSRSVLCNGFFQVVHLVRDPRAMITSISKKSGIWSDALRNSTFQCKRMLNDMKLEGGLPEERLGMIIGALLSFDIRMCALQVHPCEVRGSGGQDY